MVGIIARVSILTATLALNASEIIVAEDCAGHLELAGFAHIGDCSIHRLNSSAHKRSHGSEVGRVSSETGNKGNDAFLYLLSALVVPDEVSIVKVESISAPHWVLVPLDILSQTRIVHTPEVIVQALIDSGGASGNLIAESVSVVASITFSGASVSRCVSFRNGGCFDWGGGNAFSAKSLGGRCNCGRVGTT